MITDPIDAQSERPLHATLATTVGYGLSSQQRALWQADPASVSLWSGAWSRVDRLPPDVDLRARFRALAAEAEILRTRFVVDHADEPLQVVDDGPRVVSVDAHLTPSAGGDPIAALLGRCRRVARDGGLHGLILRLRCADGSAAVALLMRALAVDRSTIARVLRHLVSPVARPDAPGARALQYADYVGWQESVRQDASRGDAEAWNAVLGMLPPLPPAGGGPRRRGSGSRHVGHRAVCPPETWPRLEACCRQHRVEPGVVLGALWTMSLAGAGVAAGEVYAEVDARGPAGLDGFWGPMMQWVPVPMPADDRRPVLARCRSVQEVLDRIGPWMAHVPVLAAVRERPPAADSVSFAVPASAWADGIEFTDVAAPCGLALRWHDSRGRLVLEVSARRGGRCTPAELAARLQDHLHRFLSSPDAYGEAPRPEPAAPRRSGFVVADVDRHARGVPDRVAVVCQDAALTYAELARQSDAVARALVARGVAAGSVVALHMTPSLDLVAGMLGVAKAGAAFLPVDHRTPPQRARYMLEQASAGLVLTGGHAPRLDTRLPLVHVRDAIREGAARAVEPRMPAADATAYILYTSGSTGQPKGVAVSWCALAHYLSWCLERYDVDDGASIVHTSIGFDLTLTALLAPLAAGRATYIVPETNDITAYARLIERTPRLSFLKVTPAQLRLLDERLGEGGATLPRVLVVGGEALEYEDLGPWLRAGQVRVVNEYGPTEATVGCCCHVVEDFSRTGPVPIGRAIAGASIHVLDDALRPVARGARGEIHVSGAGLARGYVGAPHLTAERFLPDPFAAAPGSRMYRTGDVASARADGELVYHGRRDDQVKVRGHRVELGEVAAAIKACPEVASALVRPVPAAGGEPGLGAYVVLATRAQEARSRAAAPVHFDDWRRVFEDAYGAAAGGRFAGWTSSYTGEPIPEAEMEAWLDETVARVLALSPRRLLEIGCGSGLVAARLIPGLRTYAGIDVSVAAIDDLTRRVADLDTGSCQVRLAVGAAHELDRAPAGAYDTIVLSSVVQYFPDEEYVRALVKGCMTRLAPGGRIFIGDVRNADLLETFLFTVEWERGDRSGSAGSLRRRVQQRAYAERELNLGPSFFLGLPRTVAGVAGVDIQLKGSRHANELTRFRYDVVIRAAGQDATLDAEPIAPPCLDWESHVGSLDALRTLLVRTAGAAISVSGIPNGRVVADEEAWRRIRNAPDEAPAAQLVEAGASRAGIDPADVLDLAAGAGYRARAAWAGEGRGAFGAVLWKEGAAPPYPGPPARVDRRARANRPLASRIAADLLPELRDRLRERLPEYMLPDSLLVLDAFPMGAHGKVASRHLPWPSVSRPVVAGFTPPGTPLEERLCRVWAEVLGVERVGVDDGFFRLGGHSLLAIKLVYRIKAETGRDVTLRQFFDAHTVRGLAALVARDAAAAPPAAPPASREEIFVPDPASWHDPFPLTDVQQAYVAGRSPEYGLGGVSAHCYLEFETDALDVVRLEAAIDRLGAIHGMLRSVIRADGAQQVLRRVPRYHVAIHDLSRLDARDRGRALLTMRRRISHQVLPLGRWPLLEIRASRITGARARLHLSLDNLLFDGLSMEILASHLGTLYATPFAPLATPPVAFRDVVVHDLRQRSGAAYREAADYWLRRLPDFPAPPELPRRLRPAAGPTRFERLRRVLPPSTWTALQSLARYKRVTPSALLCAAFADVLGLWAKTPRFRLHLTFFNRRPIHPDIDRIVGDFTSLILLEVDVSQHTSLERRAQAVQRQLAADLEHSLPGGVWFLRELGRFHASRRPQPAVVFTSTLGLERVVEPSRGAIPLREVFSTSQTPQVALDHSVYESAGALHVTWDYATGLLPEGLPEEMFEVHLQYLDRLAADPRAWRAASGPELPRAARRTIAAMNATGWKHAGGLLHEHVWASIAARPEAIAVRTPDRALTYAQLGAWTAGLVERLQEAGAAPGDLVAIFLEKGWEQVIAALAIASLGAAYVPLDPAWPDERLRRVLRQCTPRAAVTRGDVARLVAAGTAPVRMEDVRPRAAARPPRAAADPLAYVLFTSGTTGTPKGVAIRHSGAVNTIHDIVDRFRIGPGDGVLQISSLTFDLSVFDVFGTLGAGATLVIPRDGQWDPAHWHDLVIGHRVTIWNSVPTLFDMYLLHLSGRLCATPPIRLALLSGDWIPLSLPDRARPLMWDVALVSLGGATEASIWSVAHPIGSVDPDWPTIPYGRPLRNQELYVVDDRLAPRPFFAVGQIAIAGVGLAEGYWRDPETTGARFRFSPALGRRVYLTGDLGRLHPDGNVEIIGREDQQVKIHGYRIELGDVEAALGHVPWIREAAVRAVPARDGSGKRLVAYVVPSPGTRADATAVRESLARVLPAYMIPREYCVLEALPLTPNGKVDRAALPDPDPEQEAAVPRGDAFATELEREVAGAWQAVLGIDVRDRDADFFVTGGDSMKTIQLINWVRGRFGREVPLRGFLADPTIRGMAAQLASHAGSPAPASRERPKPAAPQADADAGESFPLTDVQFSYWVGRSDRGGLTRASSHAYSEFSVRGFPWHAFRDACLALLRRHEMLRCQVRPDARQWIAPLSASHLPKLVDLEGLDKGGRARALATLRAGLSHRVYPAVGSPLLTLVAARLQGRRFVIHASIDLLICDGYSALVIGRDLARLLTPGVPPPPPLETSFRDSVRAAGEFEATEEFRKSRDYWMARADTFPPAPSLPLRARGPARAWSRFTRLEAHLPAADWSKLRTESVGRGLTPSGLLCSALAQVLGMWSVQRRFAVNVTLFDRYPFHPQVNDLVGVFTTTFLLEVEHLSVLFEAFARQVQSRLWLDIEHRHFNGVKFIRELRRRGTIAGAGYPVVFTSTLGAAGTPPAFPWRGEGAYAISQTSGVLLDCQVAESAGALYVNWDVVEEAFEAGSIRQMFRAFVRLLGALHESGDAWRMACR